MVVGRDADPVSATVTQHLGAVRARRRHLRPVPPSGVNFTALDSRLSSTCLSRSSSARTGPTSGGHLEAEPDAVPVARSRIRATPCSKRRRTSTGASPAPSRRPPPWRGRGSSLSSSSRCRPERQDVAEVLLLSLVEVAEHPLEQHLGEADDRVQRGPQLVRHAREELRLVPAGHLQLGAADLQRPDQVRVADGDGGVCRERGQQGGLALVERLDLGAPQVQHADQVVVEQQRRRRSTVRNPATRWASVRSYVVVEQDVLDLPGRRRDSPTRPVSVPGSSANGWAAM